MLVKSGVAAGLQLVVIIASITRHQAVGEGVLDQGDLIQDSVRRLLGVETVPVPVRNASLPPQFVMDLYERYRSGRSPMQGNTVRSILPIRDIMGEGDVFIFNLSRIHPDEQILQGKLFILKRQRPKSGKKRDHSFRIKIGNLPHLTSHRFLDVSLSRRTKKSQWRWYDITDSINQCRQGKGDHLLGATLEIKRAKGSYRLVHFKRLLRHNSQPFVLIYSDMNNNHTRSPLKPNPQNGLQGLLRHKVERDSFSSDDYSNDQDYSSEDYSLKDRRKRSVHGAPYSMSATTQVKKRLSKNEFEYVLSFLNFESMVNVSDFKILRSIVDVLTNATSNFSDAKVTREVLSQILDSTSMSRVQDLITSISNFKSLVPKIFSNINNSLDLVDETSKKLVTKTLLKVLLNSVLHLKGHKSVAETDHLRTQFTLKRQRAERSISPTSGTFANSKELKVLHNTGNTFQTISDKPVHGLYSKKTNGDKPFVQVLSSSIASIGDKPGLNPNQTIGDELNFSKTISETTVHEGISSDKMARRRNRQKGRTSRKHKHKRRRHKKLPFWWTRHASKFHSSDRKNLCQRKSLVVDFTKLGWGEWVMSPKSFNAYYCSGSCDFPLTKDTHPSNHAAIQSLVYALGRVPSVPAPCCVPSQTSSLTMLYFDENGSLVLKSYSDMIVDKCACR